ncbi:MAG: hypothetical protein IPJ04_16745 [Candidatus Eisenbacteria bacterium]|nr:hypothetical protein [Candidatus Eisenbacteria bacterium]
MKRLQAWMAAACVGLVLAAAAPSTAPEAELALARETAKSLMGQTKQLLEAQLKESGPVAAIGSCSSRLADGAAARAGPAGASVA